MHSVTVTPLITQPRTQPHSLLSHTVTHNYTVSHAVTHKHAVTPSATHRATLSHLQPVTLSITPSAVLLQKYHHTLNDSGHTCLQPHSVPRPHSYPDVLTLTLHPRHIDLQRDTDILCLGSPASVLATWPHRVTAPLGHQEGKQNGPLLPLGVATQLSLDQCLDQTNHSKYTAIHPHCQGVTEQAASRYGPLQNCSKTR